MSLTVGLTFDLKDKIPSGAPADILAEHDSLETVSSVEKALRASGRKVVRIGSSRHLLKKMNRLKCDIVFNIAEGISGRNRESEVPILLDIAGIPYTGPDALTLSASLDKITAKKIFKFHGIPTPLYFEISGKGDLILPKGIRFPLIVKPRYEGSAKGIGPDSVVRNAISLERQVKKVMRRYRQPALVEEFIDGWEFTAGIIGNEDPVVLPVVQRHVEADTALSSHIFDKACADRRGLTYRGLLDIDAELEEKIRGLAIEAFKVLDCRDFTRIDFRVSPERRAYILEVNPLPSLAKDDYFAMVAELIGITYERMINNMFDAALERCGLS